MAKVDTLVIDGEVTYPRTLVEAIKDQTGRSLAQYIEEEVADATSEAVIQNVAELVKEEVIDSIVADPSEIVEAVLEAIGIGDDEAY